MKSAPLEKNITRAILAYLRTLPECRVSKRPGGLLQGGEPDIYGCLRGRHLELEVKRPGGKLTARQQKALERWESVGALVGVVRSVDEVRVLIGEL